MTNLMDKKKLREIKKRIDKLRETERLLLEDLIFAIPITRLTQC